MDISEAWPMVRAGQGEEKEKKKRKGTGILIHLLLIRLIFVVALFNNVKQNGTREKERGERKEEKKKKTPLLPFLPSVSSSSMSVRRCNCEGQVSGEEGRGNKIKS